jgi:hypothetical protein
MTNQIPQMFQELQNNNNKLKKEINVVIDMYQHTKGQAQMKTNM